MLDFPQDGMRVQAYLISILGDHRAPVDVWMTERAFHYCAFSLFSQLSAII